MLGISNVWSVARFEARLLLRSWKFWILTLLCLGFSFLMNLYYSAINFWVSGMSGSIGAVSQSFALVMQYTIMATFYSLAVVWFAYDYRHKDRAARVAEVLYSRPLSNAQIVCGKYFGILIPIVILSLALAAVSTATRLIPGWFKGPLQLRSQVAALGLQTLPGIFFIVALVFMLVAVLRSRALAIVATYAIFITVTFVFGLWKGPRPEYLPIFDFMGFSENFMRSDLIGFNLMGRLITQRVYLVAVITLCLTVATLLFPRRRSSKRFPSGAAALMAVCVLTMGAYVGHVIVRTQGLFARKEEARKEQAALADHRPVTVTDMRLKVAFPGSHSLKAAAGLSIRNDNDEALDEAVFVLNAGMDIEEVKGAQGAPLAFRRGKTVFVVELSPPLAPGAETALEVSYHGGIDPDTLFLTSKFEPSELKGRNRGQVMFMLGLIPSYIGKYTFLLGETQWYPVANVRYGYTYPDRAPVSYFRTRVETELPSQSTVVSAGEKVEERDLGHGRKSVVWESAVPVPAVPLLVGPYEVVETEIDGRRFALYYYQGHRKNVDYFEDTGALVKERIGQRLARYKDRTGLAYPYPALSVVEVPYQARAYGGGWQMANILVQPGVILMRESTFFSSNFSKTFEQMTRRAEKRGEAATPAKIKIDMLDRYFTFDFTGGQIEHNMLRNYWDFRLNAVGPNYPLLDYALGNYIAEKASGQRPYHSVYMMSKMNEVIQQGFLGRRSDSESDIREGFINASLDMDRIQAAMERTPLDKMDPAEDQELFFNVLTVKGRAFIRTLAEILGDKFPPVLEKLVAAHQFGAYTMGDFRRTVESVQGEDLGFLFDQWLHTTRLPGFHLVYKEAYRIKSPDPRPAYQVVLRIRNEEDAVGYGKLRVKTEGDEVTKILSFEGRQEKEIGMVVPGKPERVIFAPILAKNRKPLEERLRLKDEELPQRIEHVVNVPYASEEHGIIIDDLDPGFTLKMAKRKGLVSLFRRAGGAKDGALPAYFGFRSPTRWYEWNTNSAYGKYKRTLKLKMAGEGKEEAIWKASVPAKGRYEVFTYMGVDNDSFRGRPSRRPKLGTAYRYTISHADGEETVTFDAASAEPGWNSLGTFYFEPDKPAVITLADGGEGMIIVDAVKLEPESDPSKTGEDGR